MSRRFRGWASVDDHERLVFDPRLVDRLGLLPGTKVSLEIEEGEIRLSRPVTHLAKVYVEPTNACNLNCRTCVRNEWDEPIGRMSAGIFERVIEGLGHFSPRPAVFFGGFGEPLTHPQIVEMVARAKAAGSRTELITNGMLLTDHRGKALLAAGLDALWVSLDGARPESYADIRLGAELPGVLENLQRFYENARLYPGGGPQIGVAFVAMRRNIADLPDLLRLGSQIGASRFMVTNLLPYAPGMCAETLYDRSLGEPPGPPTPDAPMVDLPRFDLDDLTLLPLLEAARLARTLEITGNGRSKGENRCPFIARGTLAVGWDGGVSPCLPLLHTHTSYWEGSARRSRRYTTGSLEDRSLEQLWNDPAYVAFRLKVQEFDFSPCVLCWSCELSETNEEDCFGNLHPTCGGCLWAQGVIQCP